MISSQRYLDDNIVHETTIAYVYKMRTGYEVRVNKATHSVSDCLFALNEDGLSLAIARADYLTRRASGGLTNFEKVVYCTHR